MSALQALAAKPDCSDCIRTMKQHWHGLRTITLPQITIPNIPANSPCSSASFPHANPPMDQPGHPQYGASARSRSPSCASTSQQRGGERRPPFRKRNERYAARTLAPALQNVRSSHSSIPPLDKKAPASKLSQLKSVMSESSVLPPPPSSQHPEPTSQQQSTSRISPSQRAVVTSAASFLR